MPAATRPTRPSPASSTGPSRAPSPWRSQPVDRRLRGSPTATRTRSPYSSSGAQSDAEYQAWISAFARGPGRRKAVVILEPDALASLPSDRGPDSDPGAITTGRFADLNHAIDALERQPNSVVYLDAGNGHWRSVGVIAQRLLQAGPPTVASPSTSFAVRVVPVTPVPPTEKDAVPDAVSESSAATVTAGAAPVGWREGGAIARGDRQIGVAVHTVDLERRRVRFGGRPSAVGADVRRGPCGRLPFLDILAAVTVLSDCLQVAPSRMSGRGEARDEAECRYADGGPDDRPSARAVTDWGDGYRRPRDAN
ncbi:glycoside hydrolase family 6 protein [Streptomyces flavidovirens]|uniref:glycoside hydrolase family 6 protein n=1 Tax=Streptomyces flavidovirens TaxID=67298 RepID=UPI00367E2B1E